MRKLDPQEREIVRQLIRNPRFSDNKIAKRTGIPAMTVNRKRKKLEADGLLYYFTLFDTSEMGLFGVRKLYIIKFKVGITAKMFLKALKRDEAFQAFNQEHIAMSYLCEKDGHFALIIILDAVNDNALLEHFNGFIVPHLNQLFGDDCIVSTETTKLHRPLRIHHNYLPTLNMENGVVKEDWGNEHIFVDELHEKY